MVIRINYNDLYLKLFILRTYSRCENWKYMLYYNLYIEIMYIFVIYSKTLNKVQNFFIFYESLCNS